MNIANKMQRTEKEHLLDAVARGRLDLVKLLVEQGAGDDASAGFGWKLLKLASERGGLDMVTYLIGQGFANK